MKTPEAALRDLQNELNHIYQRIDFRDEKYNEHCEEWQTSEVGVVYLEQTTKLRLLGLELQSKIVKIDPSLLNPVL